MDGWARGEHSPAYFGYFGPDLERWIVDEMSRPQRVLMGRRTYEALAAVPDDARDEGYDRLARMTTTVFSRTLTGVEWPGATIESRDVVESIRELKDATEVPLRTMGSISVVQQLLNASLVDRLQLMVFPLLVGPGGRESAFAGVGESDLAVIGERVLDGRIILVEYTQTGRPIPH